MSPNQIHILELIARADISKPGWFDEVVAQITDDYLRGYIGVRGEAEDLPKDSEEFRKEMYVICRHKMGDWEVGFWLR